MLPAFVTKCRFIDEFVTGSGHPGPLRALALASGMTCDRSLRKTNVKGKRSKCSRYRAVHHVHVTAMASILSLGLKLFLCNVANIWKRLL